MQCEKNYDNYERSIHKKFRKKLWTPFINAIKQYKLIEPGDKIAVCISGGKDSMLMAKLMASLHAHSDFEFEVINLCMNPGYSEVNLNKIKSNAELLELELNIFESNIFDVANQVIKSPCYLCARMRRGHLYNKAQELGCNKIALGHHMNDVIETILLSMFYGAQLQCMPPKLHSTNFDGMQLIRPLYCIKEEDIIAWRNYNNLEFLQCACKFTENTSSGVMSSKRLEIKNLIKDLRRGNPDIERNIFKAAHAVSIDTFPAFKSHGAVYSLGENF